MEDDFVHLGPLLNNAVSSTGKNVTDALAVSDFLYQFQNRILISPGDFPTVEVGE